MFHRFSFFISAIVLLFATSGRAAEHTRDNESQVKENLASGAALLIDVREVDEWTAGHIRDAQNVPLSELRSGRGYESLPRDKILYLHCQSGRRVLPAADILTSFQFRDVRPLAWGYPELVQRGFPPSK